jgi:hypothetical protein
VSSGIATGRHPQQRRSATVAERNPIMSAPQVRHADLPLRGRHGVTD